MDLTIAGILALDGLTNGAIYALLALATVLVFAVTRVIFIPQGEFVAFGALTLAMLQGGQVPGTVWFLLVLAGADEGVAQGPADHPALRDGDLPCQCLEHRHRLAEEKHEKVDLAPVVVELEVVPGEVSESHQLPEPRLRVGGDEPRTRSRDFEDHLVEEVRVPPVGDQVILEGLGNADEEGLDRGRTDQRLGISCTIVRCPTASSLRSRRIGSDSCCQSSSFSLLTR